jgi:hypothetical protein
MDENRHLPRPYDELGTVFDLIVIAGKPPDERVPRIVDPFNNVDQFAAKFIEKPHTCPLV